MPCMVATLPQDKPPPAPDLRICLGFPSVEDFYIKEEICVIPLDDSRYLQEFSFCEPLGLD